MTSAGPLRAITGRRWVKERGSFGGSADILGPATLHYTVETLECGHEKRHLVYVHTDDGTRMDFTKPSKAKRRRCSECRDAK